MKRAKRVKASKSEEPERGDAAISENKKQDRRGDRTSGGVLVG
jgi:hypothetical protein